MVVARSALKSFNKEVKLDGVTYKDKEGWCYEEYASPQWNKEPRVLNGFGYALLEINDYYEASRDENARKLFELGISYLKAHLADYDTGSWTNYDALGLRATPAYHHMHVSILEMLYNITGDSSIKLYRDKWRGYELKQGFGASKSLLEMDKEIPLLKIYPMIE
jgi:heparosan-N-sulfate-glucuronate 5-epimerase